jgi:multicomponent Na+:H+ antiporter subunit F
MKKRGFGVRSMTEVFYAAAAVVLVNVAISLVRVMKGPTRADRMMGTQLIGTGGVAMLVLLSVANDQPGVLDVALLLALLSAFAAVGFVKSLGHGDTERPERDI